MSIAVAVHVGRLKGDPLAGASASVGADDGSGVVLAEAPFVTEEELAAHYYCQLVFR